MDQDQGLAKKALGKALMAYTAASTGGALAVAAANSAEEHARVLQEPSDGAKEKRRNGRKNRGAMVGGGIPAVILRSVSGDMNTF